MRRLLTAAQLKEADRTAIQEIGIPSPVLMERAALAVTEELCGGAYDLTETLIVCGTGNNGGDGVAVARQMAERGCRVRVCLLGREEKRSRDLRDQLSILTHYPVSVETEFIPAGATLLVDAIFGIGLAREITGETAEVIRRMNGTCIPTVAVDVPSGVSPDSGQILGTAVKAAATVTFTEAMPGLYLYPGAASAGRVLVRRIGIPMPPEQEDAAPLYAVEDDDLQALPVRDPAGNKGTFGKLLVIAGSEKICGAAYLAAKAAMLTGIGMVRILTHEANREAIAKLFPEALITDYKEDSWSRALLEEAIRWADAAVIGPGLGTGALSGQILEDFLAVNTLPAVMDADALNLMARDPALFSALPFPCIITPHIGEMCRLTGKSSAEIKSDPVRTAREAAARWKVTCVLKDARTVTAAPDGKAWLNLSGCSALATAGSGDVLSGIIGGMLLQCRGTDLPAAALSVFLHGRLGEKAAGRTGERSVLASDLLERIFEFM